MKNETLIARLEAAIQSALYELDVAASYANAPEVTAGLRVHGRACAKAASELREAAHALSGATPARFDPSNHHNALTCPYCMPPSNWEHALMQTKVECPDTLTLVSPTAPEQEKHICECGTTMICPDIGCDRNKDREASVSTPSEDEK